MSKVKLLDGGFSSQLSKYVGTNIDGHPLWTARFLATNPEAIVATHLDFLRAGSDIISTNTYQASIPGFVQHLGVTEEEGANLIYHAVNLTKNAINIYKKEIEGDSKATNCSPLIAGSCGAFGAALHDGSEYSGLYGKSTPAEVITEWHKPRIEALVNSGVDLLAFETIPSECEAKALIELLKEFPNTKAWLSFSCRDDGKSISDGTNFQEVAISCYRNALPGQLLAVGVNCLSPNLVTPLLKDINKEPSSDFIPLIIYPNSGEKYIADKGWTEGDNCKPLEGFVHEWLDLGVRYIGSCCRTFAEDIAKIGQKVKDWQEIHDQM